MVEAFVREPSCRRPLWAGALAVVLLLLRAQPALAQAAACPVPGTWEVVDPRVQTAITSIVLSNDGQYRGGPWGRDFGGPNGLGANRYQCDNGRLAFIYIQAGRARVDEMLSGVLRPATDGYLFRCTGGYYCQSQNRNMEFLLRQPQGVIPR